MTTRHVGVLLAAVIIAVTIWRPLIGAGSEPSADAVASRHLNADRGLGLRRSKCERRELLGG